MTRDWSRAPPASTCQHRLADDLRAVHQAAQALVEGIAAVHDAAIVPQHQVACAPLLVPREVLLGGVCPHRIEQGLALLDRQAMDVGTGTAAEEQRPALAHGMQADEGMHRARRMPHVEGPLETLAQLT